MPQNVHFPDKKRRQALRPLLNFTLGPQNKKLRRFDPGRPTAAVDHWEHLPYPRFIFGAAT
jgi:hypothetical protein